MKAKFDTRTAAAQSNQQTVKSDGNATDSDNDSSGELMDSSN